MSSRTDSSRRHYSQAPVIHFRESSSDSRTSYDSRSSAEQRQYASSRSDMGYYSGSHSMAEEPKERKYRIPDDYPKHVTSTSRGKVDVINHRKRVIDPEAPRASEATSSHYKETHKSSKHRSHGHKSS